MAYGYGNQPVRNSMMAPPGSKQYSETLPKAPGQPGFRPTTPQTDFGKKMPGAPGSSLDNARLAGPMTQGSYQPTTPQTNFSKKMPGTPGSSLDNARLAGPQLQGMPQVPGQPGFGQQSLSPAMTQSAGQQSSFQQAPGMQSGYSWDDNLGKWAWQERDIVAPAGRTDGYTVGGQFRPYENRPDGERVTIGADGIYNGMRLNPGDQYTALGGGGLYGNLQNNYTQGLPSAPQQAMGLTEDQRDLIPGYWGMSQQDRNNINRGGAAPQQQQQAPQQGHGQPQLGGPRLDTPGGLFGKFQKPQNFQYQSPLIQSMFGG